MSGHFERCSGRGKYALLALVAVALGLWAYSAYAGNPGRPFCGLGGGHWGHHAMLTEDDMKDFTEFGVKRFARHVNATKGQQEELTKEIQARIPKAIELKKRHDAVRERIMAALAEETVDRAKLEAARKDGSQIAVDMGDMLVETTMAVSGILTPEQRKALVEQARKRSQD